MSELDVPGHAVPPAPARSMDGRRRPGSGLRRRRSRIHHVLLTDALLVTGFRRKFPDRGHVDYDEMVRLLGYVSARRDRQRDRLPLRRMWPHAGLGAR